MTAVPSVTRFLLLLGLGFFFGLAFEEFHARVNKPRPGGVRTFPMLALIGALLYHLDPERLIPFSTGLLLLGGLLACYYWHHLAEKNADDLPDVGLMVPTCNLLAYLLGPTAIAAPPWVGVGATTAAVLLLTSRERLHAFARGLNTQEIVTAGKFLILTGFVLPLLPDTPVTNLTDITPHQVWLAMLAVCTISYASYLLQRYVAPPGAKPLVAVLGGFYSSTATTIVLARRAHAEPAARIEAVTGILLATAVMYLRLLVIILLFNRPGGGIGAHLTWTSSARPYPDRRLAMDAARSALLGRDTQPMPLNPLELGAAAAFAVLFVAVSIAASWAQSRYGAVGIYGLAAIVGLTDIDPFVLSLAQHSTGQLPGNAAAFAIVAATCSNNLVKAAYALVYSGGRTGMAPALALAGLAACGIGLAAVIA